MLCASWQYEVIKISDAKRIGAIKKVFTGFTMQKPENDWMKQYPSTVYQSVFIDLADAFSRWRKGLSGFPKPITKKKGNSFTVTLATCSDSATYDMPVSTKKAKIKLGKLQYRDRNKVLGN